MSMYGKNHYNIVIRIKKNTPIKIKKNTGLGCHFPPEPGIQPTSPALAGGFFTTELPEKLKPPTQ